MDSKRGNTGRSKVQLDRRQFLGATALAAAVACMPGHAVAQPARGRLTGDPDAVDDGAYWPDPAWQATPRHVRQMLFQASEVLRAEHAGMLMPFAAMRPLPLLFVLRSAPGAPVTAAWVVGHPHPLEGAEPLSFPAGWHLGTVQAIDSGPLLERIAINWTSPAPYADVRVDGWQAWGTVVRHDTGYGLVGDNWGGSAVWLHEYVHGIQPRAPLPPEGWSEWDMTLRFPEENAALHALSQLEQEVLNAGRRSPMDAHAALQTFLAIREYKRATHGDYVSCCECREVSEGVATYTGGSFLAFGGYRAVSPESGRAYQFPPLLPDEVLRWKHFYAGEIAYAGSGILFTLDVMIGRGWRGWYSAQGLEGPGVSLPDLVRRHVAQPDPGHAQRLIAQAAARHDLDAIQRRIEDADLPNLPWNP